MGSVLFVVSDTVNIREYKSITMYWDEKYGLTLKLKDGVIKSGTGVVNLSKDWILVPDRRLRR